MLFGVLGFVIGISAEDFASQRQKAIEEFNHSNDTEPLPVEIETEAPRLQAPEPIRPQQTESDSGSTLDATPSPAKAKEQTLSSESRGGYWRRLKNVYGCLLDFLRGVFKARSQSDFEVVECTTQGQQACVNDAHAKNNEEVLSLQEGFFRCLDRP